VCADRRAHLEGGSDAAPPVAPLAGTVHSDAASLGCRMNGRRGTLRSRNLRPKKRRLWMRPVGMADAVNDFTSGQPATSRRFLFIQTVFWPAMLRYGTSSRISTKPKSISCAKCCWLIIQARLAGAAAASGGETHRAGDQRAGPGNLGTERKPCRP
jgi:hypothetical protein